MPHRSHKRKHKIRQHISKGSSNSALQKDQHKNQGLGAVSWRNCPGDGVNTRVPAERVPAVPSFQQWKWNFCPPKTLHAVSFHGRKQSSVWWFSTCCQFLSHLPKAECLAFWLPIFCKAAKRLTIYFWVLGWAESFILSWGYARNRSPL